MGSPIGPNRGLVAALADRYRIERELGQGGMATVYLAHDIKHDRKVAIKVLKPELAAVLGADRFVQEIRTTAALQHPHILPLFDSGVADTFLFYVMPFIDGETLRAKLDRETQLGINEAVKITTDVADALDYAHRHGVIHRDIKPENILLHDGRPMVADFGIALAVSAAAGGRMTETGLSLGTPHYMSPEQATAEKEITNRSDIYSLGSVLYEMLTGNPPHTGATAQQIIMKIVTEEASPVTKLRKAVPNNVAAAVAKSIEKLPADRFESARAFADALVDPSFHTLAAGGARAWTGDRGVSRRAFGSLAVLAVLLLGALVWSWLRPMPPLPVTRYGLALPAVQGVLGTQSPMPAPDGSFLVYFGPGGQGGQLWIKRRESSVAEPIPGTAGVGSFTISPDGLWIAFAVGNQLKKLAVAGGTVTPLVGDSVGNPYGLAWLDDNTIVYVEGGARALKQVSANGGASKVLRRTDTRIMLTPSPLPNSRGVLFTWCTQGCAETAVWVLDLKTDSAHLVVPHGEGPVFLRTGHLVYDDGIDALFAVPFDLNRLEATGAPVALGEQVAAGGQGFHISTSGMLTTVPGGAGTRTFEMVWADRNGRETSVDSSWTFQLTAVAGNHGWSLSPDGTKLAIGLSTSAGDDIWVKPLPKGAPYRLTDDPATDFRPHWSGDSKFVTFSSSRQVNGLYQRRADGTGQDSLLRPGVVDEGLVTADRKWILIRSGAVGSVAGGRNISGVRAGADTSTIPLLAGRYDEEAIALSPDGKLLAYQSDETGVTEIFVRPFPDVNATKKQISSGGGLSPLWSRDGKELFYLSGDKRMMAVKVAYAGTITASDPVALFHVRDELLGAESRFYTPWDVAKDGRFIMARTVSGIPAQGLGIVVVENWIEEFTRKMKK